MTNLTKLTMHAALDHMAKGDFTSVELTQAHIDAMGKAQHLKAFITETPELALQMAKAADAKRAKGEAGLMNGIPIGMKDLFCTNNVRTTAASKILENFVPPYESTVSANLFNQGAVMLGKTNLDQFAMGSSSKTSAYGTPVNPWRDQNNLAKELVAGGSGGGTSAALAARLVMAATGTDTGGSIRQPASLTGTVGLKPTYGRCSRFGCIAFASSLDTPGPATRNITDTAIMLQAMAGFDAQDSTSVNVPVPNYRAALTGNIKGLKVGIPREYKIDGINAEVQKMWDQTCDWLRQAGAEIVDISLPHTAHALPCYYVLAPAEASSNLSRYDGMRFGLRVEGKDLNDTYERSRGAGFGEEVKKRILIGTYVLSAGYFDAYYIKAQKIRRLIQQDFIEAYKKVDVILTPATPSAAFGPDDKDGDPIAIYLEDVFTVTANLAGVPGIAVPAGLNSQGLPMGVQLLGKPFDEATLLNAGLVIEQAANFNAEPDYEWYKK